jgi:SAM-dependent methyltransferase
VGDWWDRFFDQHYLRTYAPRQPDQSARQEVLSAMRLARAEPGAQVLDLPCGFGRHSVPLARAGYLVTGMDRSAALLAEACRRRGQEQGPNLVRADYRAVPARGSTFDVVLNLFTALGYLGDAGDLSVLEEFCRVLRPGGWLVIETLHRDALARRYESLGVDMLPDAAYLVEERSFDLAGGVMEATHTLLVPGKEADSRSFRMRVYTATELIGMVERAGFVDVSFFGDLQGAPLSLESRLTLVARKPL